MASSRPPRVPLETDDYGGHANYRERVREIVSFKPDMWLGVLISFGIWYAAGKLASLVIDSGPSPHSLLPIFSYAVCGTVGFFAYLIALGFASSPPAKRGMLAGGMLLILFAAFYPFVRDVRLERVPEGAVDAAARERWLDELRERGNVAAPGVVPPLVAVQERDGAVLVRNASGRPLVLQLALVNEAFGRGGLPTWQRCPLFNGSGGFSDADTRYWLPPHVSAWFKPGSYCGERLLYSEIEYRIGDERTPSALGWRSTSALLPAAD